ncbi:MAG: hypothetical protein R3F39_09600 [Myxococcota bacterium]
MRVKTRILGALGAVVIVFGMASCATSASDDEISAGGDDRGQAQTDGVSVLDVGVFPDAAGAPDAAGQPDALMPCGNQCTAAFATVPQCKVTSWDIKTCTCSLRPAGDGGACDDGEACTAGDHCQAGVCVGGGPDYAVEPADGWSEEGNPLLPQAWEPGAPAVIYRPTDCRLCDNSRAFLRFSRNGEFSVAGANIAQGDDGNTWVLSAPGYLTAYDPSLSPGSAGPASKQKIHLARGLERLPHGPTRFVAAGVSLSLGRGWLAGYAATGEIQWELSPQAWSNLLVLGLTTAADGTIYGLACGAARATILMVSPDGALIGEIALGAGRDTTTSTYGIVLTSESDIVVSYGSDDSVRLQKGQSWPRAVAARYTFEGELAWARELGDPQHQTAGGPLVALPTGYLVVGIEEPDLFAPTPRVVPFTLWHLRPSGEILSAQTFTPPWTVERQRPFPYNAIETPDGGALVIGYMQRLLEEGPTMDSFLLKLDSWANPEWMRFYGGPLSDQLVDAVFQDNGTITAVGAVVTSGIGGGIDRFILRTDFWGRTCGMRLGVCAEMAWQDCEDGNPCTINWCDPDAGCTHPALPDGSPCGEGLTCQGAVCK